MEDPSRACVSGPLLPYAAGFTAELARLGYTSGSAYGQMLLMAHLSRWLTGEGLDAGSLTPEAAERFLASRRAVGYRLYLSPKALAPLLGYLRRLGAAPQAPAAVPAGPAGELLDRYQRYLVTERGLGAATAADYAAKTRSFLAARLKAGAPGLASLTAADVTAFAAANCPQMRKGTAKLTVTALRSLLGYMHVAGDIPGPLAWAVPAVATWRLASLPAPLEPGPRNTPLAVPSLVTAATSVSAARRCADTSPSGVSGRTFSSLWRNPALFLLTPRTSSACCPAGWFWWMNPIPPACASAIAILGDDTASMIALHNGSATRSGASSPTGCRTRGADRLTVDAGPQRAGAAAPDPPHLLRRALGDDQLGCERRGLRPRRRCNLGPVPSEIGVTSFTSTG